MDMGIDAEILVRVKRPITEAEIKIHGLAICRSLGARQFGISRDSGRGAITLTSDYSDKGLEGKVWFQDGPTILAEPGETFLQVNLWTRYYGPGYERGDILMICAVAEWVEQNIPGAEVWYGGDSSGVIAKPFPAEARAQIRSHLYTPKGRGYFKREPWGGAEKNLHPNTDDCKLCFGMEPLSQFGAGQGYWAGSCAACGQRFETHDDGKSWETKRGE